ncbi:RNA polymerase sigma factor [Shewanella avicenniae]|uniref:RNA polymerase sigma factor n=1 Tax=Shewanella avicenniae TaxID=2814294 RepID=A0ABX7QRS8_9GAMM|nr:RNA polymerase sigma factor [Shewanella avicenniae]QSX34119.1 RNA polymerase sigma factor [Shewanella avicenniae]
MTQPHIPLSAKEINQLRQAIFQLVSHYHDAEDILQDTLVNLWQQSSKQLISQPLAYALRVAQHAAFQYYRCRSRVEELTLEAMEDCPSKPLDDTLIQQQHLKQVTAQLQQMSQLRQKILLRRWLTNEPRASIAKTFNISEESVKKHLYRGTLQLQQQAIEI